MSLKMHLKIKLKILRRALLNTIFFSAVLTAVLGPKKAHAEIRIGGRAGYGVTDNQIANQKTSESPGSFGFMGEYVTDSHNTVGAEHFRSISYDQNKFSSSISFSGVYYKYFSSSAISQSEGYKDDTAAKLFIYQSNLVPFIEFGTGVAQSSIRDKIGSALLKGTVGIYLGSRVGIEMPLTDSTAVLFDAGFYGTIFGEGTTTMFSASVGGFINF